MVRGEMKVGHAETKGLRPLDPRLFCAARGSFFIELRARRWRADGARTESDAAGDGQVERGLQL